MQTIDDSYFDEIGILRTTDGTNEKVRFSSIPDDGSISITLKSKGSYRLKVGYYYTFVTQVYDRKRKKFTDELVREKLPKYHVIEKVLKEKGDSIYVPIGWNWTSGYTDETLDDGFWDEHDGEGYVESFDVMELVRCDSC